MYRFVKQNGGVLKRKSLETLISKKRILSSSGNVEIGYAFYTAGVFGKAPIKEVMSLLSGMFQINLENYPHTFFQIRERKINVTKFLDELKTALLRYFDQLDQQK